MALLSNWDVLVGYFSGGMPASEYLWAVVIVAVSIFGFYVARKMVYQV